MATFKHLLQVSLPLINLIQSSDQNRFNKENFQQVVDGLSKFFADHGYRYYPPTFANLNDSATDDRINTKENFVELLGLVLGVAMQCD